MKVNVAVPIEVYQKLKLLKKETGVPISQLIVQGFALRLEQHKAKLDAKG